MSSDGKGAGSYEFDADALKTLDSAYNGGVELYAKWVKTYEKDVKGMDYNGPEISVSMLTEFVPNKDARILDVAAGTGLVGVKAKRLGYNNVDALDGSSDMLDVARSKDIYKNYFCSVVTSDPTPGIDDNSYDVIVCCGGFYTSALANEALVEMLRIVKSGGFVIFTMMRRETSKEMEVVVEKLQENGKCKLCQKKNYDKFLINKSCDGYVVKVL